MVISYKNEMAKIKSAKQIKRNINGKEKKKGP